MDGLAFLIIKRLFYGLLTLLALSVIIFFMVELLPGDTATSLLAMGKTEENLAAMREQMGLDRPAVVRYLEWLGGVVSSGRTRCCVVLSCQWLAYGRGLLTWVG